jgi:filamentous hemagglutinin family protein
VALRNKFSLAFCVTCALVSAAPRDAAAQHITTDGSLGKAATLPGPNYAIDASLGKQVGSNLFHSFGLFGLVKGETANFNGPTSVTNVIGRVTGGSVSSIDGKIQSNIGGANLYLINPSGIVFGANATVNVSGSFHASTADYLKMSDGKIFQANPSASSEFTSAPPAAFGFLTASPPTITVNGSTLGPVTGTLGLVAGAVSITGPTPTAAPRANLSAPAGTISVTAVAGAGEVPIDPRDTMALTVTSFGRVDVTGHATLDASTPSGPGSGGSVFIRAGTLTIDASTISANNSGVGPGGQLVLRGDSQVRLSSGAAVQAVALGSGTGAAVTISTAPGGTIQADASSLAAGSAGSGDGGAVLVQTGQLTLSNGAAFASAATASGKGSWIAITADSVVLDGGATQNLSTGIFSTTASTASTAGAGGAISIVAGEVILHNRANVLAGSCLSPTCGTPAAGTLPPAGAGGAINVSVDGSLTVDTQASLGTVARGTGTAGDVSVTVTGPVAVDRSVGTLSSILAGIGSLTFGRGNAGNVTVTAGSMALSHDGLVSSLTASGAAGNSGNVSVNVSGTLSIDGSGGNSQVRTGILGDTFSAGNGGAVTVNAGSITIGGGACAVGGGTCAGAISGDTGFAAPSASGNGGNVAVTANSMAIDGAGVIESSTFAMGSSGGVLVNVAGGLSINGATAPGSFTGISSQAQTGSTRNAGPVSVSAGSISIFDNGMISGGTFGPGNGGSVSVNVAGGLTIDGAMAPPNSFTGVSSQTNTDKAGKVSTGNAGPINISAGSISLANLGRISSSTVGSGDAGQITIAAGTLSITSNGAIASATFGSGKAGGVSVAVAGQLSVDGATGDPTLLTGISSQSQGGGDAGTVSVKAGTLSIAHNSVISSDTFADGHGGSVGVTVDGPLTIDASGTNPDIAATGIVANSEAGSSGNAGDITVAAGSLSLVNGGAISSALRPFMNLPASTGKGGRVAVNVGGLLSISGSESRIGTETNFGSIGDAGSVTVNAGQITITSGGEIISTTAGAGTGGSVSVTTPGVLVLDGSGIANTQIAASATPGASGRAGSVTVSANSLTIEGGAQIASSTAGPGSGGNVDVVVASDVVLPDPGPQITARSTGSGDAGSITVSAARLAMSNGGAISTEAATSTANGGNITLKLSDFLYLTNSKITTSVKGQTGNGGNIVIDPQFVVLNHSSIVAEAVEGHGGNIFINAGEFIPSADSIVSATSQLGISGTVEITAPRVDVNSALVVLSSELRGLAAVSREACAARAGQPVSSLVEAGRGGQPQDPEATLPALYIAGRDLGPMPASPGTTEASRAIRTTVRLTTRCG